MTHIVIELPGSPLMPPKSLGVTKRHAKLVYGAQRLHYEAEDRTSCSFAEEEGAKPICLRTPFPSSSNDYTLCRFNVSSIKNKKSGFLIGRNMP